MRKYTVPATQCAAPSETRRVRAGELAPRPETGTDRRSFLHSRLPAGHARDWRRGQEARRSANSGPQLCSGAIAQSGERLLCKQEVAGSIPAGSIELTQYGAQTASCCLIQSRRAWSIRVCQPRPPAQKWSITSCDNRMVVEYLRPLPTLRLTHLVPGSGSGWYCVCGAQLESVGLSVPLLVMAVVDG